MTTQSRPEAELPELPKPKFVARLSKDGEWAELVTPHWEAEMWAYGCEDVYTADQLRAYGQQCAATRLPIEAHVAVADDFDTASHVLEEYADLQDMAARNDGQFPISINGAWASESLRALAKRLRGDL